MKMKSQERQEDSMAREVRTCKICGANFSATQEHEFCPVCMLRRAFGGGVVSGKSFCENSAISTSKDVAQRFEHYELVTAQDGQPVELGRGAMGFLLQALKGSRPSVASGFSFATRTLPFEQVHRDGSMCVGALITPAQNSSAALRDECRGCWWRRVAGLTTRLL